MVAVRCRLPNEVDEDVYAERESSRGVRSCHLANYTAALTVATVMPIVTAGAAAQGTGLRIVVLERGTGSTSSRRGRRFRPWWKCAAATACLLWPLYDKRSGRFGSFWGLRRAGCTTARYRRRRRLPPRPVPAVARQVELDHVARHHHRAALAALGEQREQHLGAPPSGRTASAALSPACSAPSSLQASGQQRVVLRQVGLGHTDRRGGRTHLGLHAGVVAGNAGVEPGAKRRLHAARRSSSPGAAPAHTAPRPARLASYRARCTPPGKRATAPRPASAAHRAAPPPTPRTSRSEPATYTSTGCSSAPTRTAGAGMPYPVSSP